jgi:NAD(P)-dependent dehydrogenase (short-subunit alcohol dehydrogenase family)
MQKTALVTGAGSGLGATIAAHLADAGYRVALLDIDGAAAAQQAAKLSGAIGLPCDVTDETRVIEAVDEVCETFGTAPDALVNNAGIVRFGPILEHSAADFRRVLDVNLTGAFLVSREVGRRMAERGSGAIVNITSLNAVAPSPDAGAYPAAKAGLAMLTQHMALALGPLGVRVNAVGPGFINSGMSVPIYADPAIEATRGATVPARRIGLADDVAEAVLFLVSDHAGYIHGQHLMVDGGVSFSLKLQMPRKAPG